MHPRTVATLDELARRDWFTRVDLHDTENADVLSSWRDAERSCASLEWRDVLLEAANQHRARRLGERTVGVAVGAVERSRVARGATRKRPTIAVRGVSVQPGFFGKGVSRVASDVDLAKLYPWTSRTLLFDRRGARAGASAR